jgi:hypothetical protein
MHFHRLKRREFITLVGGAAAWPLGVRAQQSTQRAKIGVLYPGPASALPSRIAALRDGLQAVGYRESDNVELVVRSTGGDPTRIIPLAMENDRKVRRWETELIGRGDGSKEPCDGHGGDGKRGALAAARINVTKVAYINRVPIVPRSGHPRYR